MKIITNRKQARSLPNFIELHISWDGLAETPEWKAFLKAWTAGESRVVVTALDIIASHYIDVLTRTEVAFIRGISDSLYSVSERQVA